MGFLHIEQITTTLEDFSEEKNLSMSVVRLDIETDTETDTETETGTEKELDYDEVLNTVSNGSWSSLSLPTLYRNSIA